MNRWEWGWVTVTVLGLSVVGCGGGPDESAWTLRIETEATEDVRAAVAWTRADGSASAFVQAGETSTTARLTSLTLRGAPPALAPLALAGAVDGQPRFLSIGHVVLTSPEREELPLLDREPGARVGRGSGQAVRWCAPEMDARVTDDGCFEVTFACQSASCVCPGDADCEVTDTRGDERFRHRFGLAEGVASPWLVLYAKKEVPADVMTGIGIRSELSRGYHLLRVRELDGEEREASRSCWRDAVAQALTTINAAHGTDYQSIDAVRSDSLARDVLSLAEQTGFEDLGCPVPHLGFEEVDPRSAVVSLDRDPTAEPLFDLDQLPHVAGGSGERFDLTAPGVLQPE